MTKYTTIAGDMWDGIAYKTLGDGARPAYEVEPAVPPHSFFRRNHTDSSRAGNAGFLNIPAVEARDCRMNARRTAVRLTFARVDISTDINNSLFFR